MPQAFKINSLELSAILLALMLSVACVTSGLVYDSFIAVALFLAIPLLWLSLRTENKIHPVFSKVWFFCVVIILSWVVLQWGVIEAIDVSAMQASIGRIIFVAIVGITALQISSSNSASQLFFRALLFFSIILVFATFYTHTTLVKEGVDFYSHGFVNPNNAASYLGIMIIISIVNLHILIQRHARRASHSIIELIEKIKFRYLIQGVFFLFGCLFFVAALVLTASRAGVILSLAICAFLLFTLLLKRRRNFSIRKKLLSLFLLIMPVVTILLVLLNQQGAALINDISLQGLDGDVRPELFEAIIPMIEQQPILGHGLGGFASNFQLFRAEKMPVEGLYDKAHSSYLELASEMGLPILVGLLLFISLMFVHFISSIIKYKSHYNMALMGLAILLLVLFHSLIDFPLQIPAIFALTVSVLIINFAQCDRGYVLSKPNKKLVKPN